MIELDGTTIQTTGTESGEADRRTRRKPKRSKFLLEVLYLVLKVALVALVVLLALVFVFGIAKVEDNSMNPSLKSGDLLLFYRLDHDYASGDVVAVEYEENIQLRRVVAVEGDTVNITEGGLEINGKLQQERSISGNVGSTGAGTLLYEGGIDFPVTLGPGEVFLLGDNRAESLDSRMYGPVKENIIVGKTVFVMRTRNI